MKRPQRRAQARRHSFLEMGVSDRQHAAERAVYVGSPEHKLPNTRGDGSLCPPEMDGQKDTLTNWLKKAIQAGRTGGPVEAGCPRYVWHCEDGLWYEGRLTNETLGWYKGYPVEEAEVPARVVREVGN